MPTMPATAATATDHAGTSSCLSFRPVSTVLADQPTAHEQRPDDGRDPRRPRADHEGPDEQRDDGDRAPGQHRVDGPDRGDDQQHPGQHGDEDVRVHGVSCHNVGGAFDSLSPRGSGKVPKVRDKERRWGTRSGRPWPDPGRERPRRRAPLARGAVRPARLPHHGDADRRRERRPAAAGRDEPPRRRGRGAARRALPALGHGRRRHRGHGRGQRRLLGGETRGAAGAGQVRPPLPHPRAAAAGARLLLLPPRRQDGLLRPLDNHPAGRRRSARRSVQYALAVLPALECARFLAWAVSVSSWASSSPRASAPCAAWSATSASRPSSRPSSSCTSSCAASTGSCTGMRRKRMNERGLRDGGAGRDEAA